MASRYISSQPLPQEVSYRIRRLQYRLLKRFESTPPCDVTLSRRQIEESQRLYYKHMIDRIPPPKALETIVVNTLVSATTLRQAVHYAHLRLANAIWHSAQGDLALDNHPYNTPDFSFPSRNTVYRLASDIERAEHVFDEEWLATASNEALIKEINLAVNERVGEEGVAAALSLYLEAMDERVEMKRLGTLPDVVYGNEPPRPTTSPTKARYGKRTQNPALSPDHAKAARKMY